MTFTLKNRLFSHSFPQTFPHRLTEAATRGSSGALAEARGTLEFGEQSFPLWLPSFPFARDHRRSPQSHCSGPGTAVT